MRPVIRRLSSLGPVLIAGALLAFAGWSASEGIRRASESGDRLRRADRAALATAYAAPLNAWLGAGRGEAAALSTAMAGVTTPAAAAPVIGAHLASAPPFAREVALVAADRRLVAGSAGPNAFTNRRLQPCEGGDPGQRSQVQDAMNAPGQVLAVSVPWDCNNPRAATATPAGSNFVIVFAPVTDARPRLGPVVPRSLVVAVDEPPGEPARVDDNGGYLRAYADAGDGWGVVIQQPLSDFHSGTTIEQPLVLRVLGGTVLAVALGAAMLVFAVFEQRRRRAHARAEDAKHAFFATVGHELRTPLTILRGYSETLSARWDSLSDDAKETLVSNMAPAAQRMGALVEKLLLASNIQAEAYIKPVPRPTAVPDILRRAVDRWKPLAPLHTFTVDAEPLLPEALADADALEQVLQQLLDNAAKYSPSGGRITVSAMRSRRGIDIAVTDDGVGLPSNAREIFEPLVQGEAVDTRMHDEGGAGVGLYIVRTLVRDMGGEVRAERREVPGSRFVVSLKAARSKRAAPSATPV